MEVWARPMVMDDVPDAQVVSAAVSLGVTALVDALSQQHDPALHHLPCSAC
jgi:hypothetical protein